METNYSDRLVALEREHQMAVRTYLENNVGATSPEGPNQISAPITSDDMVYAQYASLKRTEALIDRFKLAREKCLRDALAAVKKVGNTKVRDRVIYSFEYQFDTRVAGRLNNPDLPDQMLAEYIGLKLFDLTAGAYKWIIVNERPSGLPFISLCSIYVM